MPTVNATPGSASANAYCTRAEAITYHDERLHTADWDAATATNQDRAIIMATRLLDALYEWASARVDSIQALEWPRQGIMDKNRLESIPNNVIPPELKQATAEFALQLLGEDRSLDSDIETQGIRSLTAGPVSLAFKDTVIAKVVPDAVRNLIPSWWGYVRGGAARGVSRT